MEQSSHLFENYLYRQGIDPIMGQGKKVVLVALQNSKYVYWNMIIIRESSNEFIFKLLGRYLMSVTANVVISTPTRLVIDGQLADMRNGATEGYYKLELLRGPYCLDNTHIATGYFSSGPQSDRLELQHEVAIH